MCGLILAVALCVITSCSGGAESGEELWKEAKQEISEEEDIRVEPRVAGGKQILLGVLESKEYVAALLSGELDEVNTDNGGPTGRIVILLHCRDGSEVSVPQWPDGRFQVTSNGTQILIHAPQLEALLRRDGFTSVGGHDC